MAKLGKDKIALFLACASVLGGKTQAMNINKAQSPQTVAAVGGAASRNNQSDKQRLTKNQKLAIGGAASLAVVSAVGLTIWGVKRHNDKKLLESALAFLNSNPVIVSASNYDYDDGDFFASIDLFANYLKLFKDEKTDELKKSKVEIAINGGSIAVRNALNLKFVISKIDDKNWNVKKYNIEEGKEELENEFKLGIGKFQTIKNEEKKVEEKKPVSNIFSNIFDDNLKRIDKLQKEFESFKKWTNDFTINVNEENQEIDKSNKKDKKVMSQKELEDYYGMDFSFF
jgi:hypothetical protein